MKVIFVYNQKSGSALSKSELRKLCRQYGIVIEQFVELDDKLEAHLKPHIKNKAINAVLGGDGTLSAVASLVAGSDAVLAPLPGGTLNHFTKDLGISQDINEALRALSHSRPMRIDVAAVNDKVFINNSSIGLYPSSLRERNRLEDRFGKWFAATIASFRALIRFRTYEVTINDKTFHTPFVFVGNNDYKIDSFGTVERKNLTNGILTIYIAQTTSRFVLVKIACMALIGRAAELREFDMYHSRHVTISVRKKHISVSFDGEVRRMSSPLRYEIRPLQLTIRK